MSSKRQDICTAIDTAVKAILTSGGYQTNLGKHVFEWRTTPLEENELPGIIWRDKGNIYEGPVTGRTSNDLLIECEILYSGSTAPAKMRDYLSDLRNCLVTNNLWGNLSIGTSLIEDENSNIEQADRKIGATTLKFAIKYITSTSDF